MCVWDDRIIVAAATLTLPNPPAGGQGGGLGAGLITTQPPTQSFTSSSPPPSSSHHHPEFYIIITTIIIIVITTIIINSSPPNRLPIVLRHRHHHHHHLITQPPTYNIVKFLAIIISRNIMLESSVWSGKIILMSTLRAGPYYHSTPPILQWETILEIIKRSVLGQGGQRFGRGLYLEGRGWLETSRQVGEGVCRIQFCLLSWGKPWAVHELSAATPVNFT